MDYGALGKRIAKRRREMSLTQAALAEQLNKSTSFIGHLERGTRTASIDTIVTVANVLDIGLDELFTDSLRRKTPRPLSNTIA